MSPIESGPKILTLKEVSEMLHVVSATVYKLIIEGKIPSFRVGTDWRFRKGQIERWVAEKSMDNLR
jgi:excisionase family DNA binding protein